MNEKINIGEVSLQEYNVIMKQLSAGQLGECIELFMRFSHIGQEFQKAQQAQQAQPSATQTLPPPAA